MHPAAWAETCDQSRKALIAELELRFCGASTGSGTGQALTLVNLSEVIPNSSRKSAPIAISLADQHHCTDQHAQRDLARSTGD